MGGLIAPLIGYLLSEIIIGTTVKKRLVKGEYKLEARDVEEENRILRTCMLVTTAIYMLAVLIFKFIFLCR
ncbi:hypothetical protein [Clostridium cuniculi]|uniref:hypothetical protein n=1 Tax=Clostridium cuniculi TaxID=2548455 RepID=UPI0010548994|nr:hypothetical protein [Clostridium cuniculi]